MDDILNHLSHINEFRVISRTSTEKYRDVETSLSEIAKELGVSYIVEGSVQKYKNRVKIIIQLNDYNDEHVWSESYDREFDDIFNLQSEIAKEVASHLEIVLSRQEIEQIDKRYTENTEAYLLHQKGRYFWHRRGEENLKLSINYFNQALELDSNYALAYAGLANVFMVLPFHSPFPNDKAYLKTIEYANTALSIDNNLVEPHVAIATAEMYFKQNWELAKKEFLKALELNPNNAEVNQFYAEYLHLVCKHSEARIYANKAIELDPNAWMRYWVSCFLYYDEGKYNESIQAAEKMLEFGEKDQYAYSIIFKNYLHLKNARKAFEFYLKFLEQVSHNSNYLSKVSEIFETQGTKGLLEYEINRKRAHSRIDNYGLAKYYAMLGNKDSTLFYLEKKYATPQSGIGIMDIKVWIDFNFLKGNSRYNALLEKSNLPID